MSKSDLVARLVAIVAMWVLIICLAIGGMIFGWGLTPKSWTWVLIPYVVTPLFQSIIQAMGKVE